ncbi:protein of unknown function (DUF3328) domain containing protein [Rhypophila sp. PSN 637]
MVYIATIPSKWYTKDNVSSLYNPALNRRSYSVILTWALIFASISLTVFNIYRTWRLQPSDDFCATYQVPWTPVTQGLQYTWRMLPFLSFFTKSTYFGVDYLDETDHVWKELLPESPIAIPRSHLKDLDIQYESNMLHPPRDESSVLALPEVFIQLGCIQLIRQHTVHQRQNSTAYYARKPAFQGSQSEIMRRVDLCIDRLRETIMCWGDLSSVLQNITFDEGKAIPRSAVDFATRHKCRDVGGVAKWTEENAVRAVRMKDLWWGGKVFY